MKRFSLRLLVSLAILLLLTSQVAYAERDRQFIQQENETSSVVVGYVLAAAPTGIEIHAVNKSGGLNLVATLPDNIAIDRYGKADWLISSASDLKVSPDVNQIAFTAKNSTTSKVRLFIYQVNQHNLIQKELMESADLLWSPDSNSLLLSGNQTEIYDLNMDTFTEVANFSFGESIWLPDNQHIVYVGDGISCAIPCKPFNDLYVINRDGTDNHVITNLGAQIPAEVFHSICEPTWSAWEERIYYRVGCVEVQAMEYIYSTTLSGDNRIENAPTGLNLSSGGGRRVMNIDVDTTNQTIYAPMMEHNAAGELFWRVIRFRPNQVKDMLNEHSRTPGNFLQYVAHSPNGQYISLNAKPLTTSGKEFLWIVDTSNDQIIAKKENLENICQLVWSNNRTIIFTQEAGGNPSCPDEYFSIGARSLSKFDLDTGEVTPLTSQFTVPTFFISAPEN